MLNQFNPLGRIVIIKKSKKIIHFTSIQITIASVMVILQIKYYGNDKKKTDTFQKQSSFQKKAKTF